VTDLSQVTFADGRGTRRPVALLLKAFGTEALFPQYA
jgi:hypothetical protein